MGVLMDFFGFFAGQSGKVMSLLWSRWCYQWQLCFLSLKRAFYMAKSVDFLLYFFWLFSSRGWGKHQINFLKTNWLVSLLWVLCLVFIGMSFNVSSYSSFIYGLFGEMELSHRGYLGYTVFVCCTMSWFLQLALWSSSSWVREGLKPYRARLITVNLVVFLLLMCIGAQVARAKLGVRVWYPNERVYGERIGAAYWDLG